MGDIDVIPFVSCSGTLIYIINFQFQPNLRWSNFRPQYCDIESLKWPAGSEFSCQSAPNGLIFFLSSFLRAATTGIFVSKTFSKIDILYYTGYLSRKFRNKYISRKESPLTNSIWVTGRSAIVLSMSCNFTAIWGRT